jgi:hypothetical protein
MQPPICRNCKERHWGPICPSNKSSELPVKRNARIVTGRNLGSRSMKTPTLSPSVNIAKSHTLPETTPGPLSSDGGDLDKPFDRAAYQRAYMREYMRKRREAARNAKGSGG